MLKFLRSEKKPTANIDITTASKENGFFIRIKKDDTPLKLPLQLSAMDFRAVKTPDFLLLLEDLWLDELLMEMEEGFLLPFEILYDLSKDEREFFNVGEPVSLQINLDNRQFVGSKDFKIIPQYSYESLHQLHDLGDKKGPIIELPNKDRILINKSQFELFDLIEKAPEKTNSEDVFQFVAEVKKKAKQLGIAMSTHLEREDYQFVDDFELNLDQQNEELVISPHYVSTDLEQDVLDEMSTNEQNYLKNNGKRIFINKDVLDKVNKVKRMEPIKGNDIPRFIENPAAFQPEDVDFPLEAFSERVKELGLRVYRAQPFVHARNNERNWFEFDTGFHVTDDEGERQLDVTTDSIKDKVNEARNNGEEFIQLDNGSFVRIPRDAEEFIEKAETLEKESDVGTGIDFTKLPYVLEIFENVDQLEYNAPILEVQQTLKDLNVFEKQPPMPFHATLKPLQEDGFVWMKSLQFRKVGGLLADDMGLGKTIQVIALLAYLQSIEKLAPSLIVVPKTLMENWQNEITKFSPKLSGSVYFHSGTARRKNVEFVKHQKIVITTYQTLVRDQLVLGQVDWNCVICDEAQAIKNPTTAASKVLKALKASFRLAMTGTPVENSLTELWSIIDFVQPGLLGSLKQFKELYIKPLENGSITSNELENEITSKISFNYKRRTKKDELKGQLPEKNNKFYEVKMGKVQKKQYTEIVELVKEKMMPPIEAIQKLKMLSSHPAVINEAYRSLCPDQVPKLKITIDILKEIKNKGEKALIFTEYKQMQSILREQILNEFGLYANVINGETPRRQLLVDQFNQKSGFDVLLLSPKAAGTGLTITSANHVIHYTRWWNPAVENQATDRVYRIGQEKDVTVHYPIVKGSDSDDKTVEQIINKIIAEKQELAQNVIVPSRDLDIQKEVLGNLKFH